MVVLPLINNIALLITLSLVYNFLVGKTALSAIKFKILSGFLFGLFTIIGMFNSIELYPGVFFDGRSIILSVSGLFGGPITAIIAMVIGGTYRLYLGGGGMIMGMGVILSSTLVGILFYYLRRNYLWSKNFLFYFSLGLFVHIVMLALTIALPSNISVDVLKKIAFPVLIIYPLGSYLICLFFLHNESDSTNKKLLKESEENYRQLVEKASSLIVKLDSKGRIIFINAFTEKEFGYQFDELIGRQVIGTFITHTKKSFKEFASLISVLLVNPEMHYSTETEVVCKNGDKKWVSWTYKVHPNNDDPNDLEIICIGNDITQRKNIELALTRSEKKYRLLYESLMDGYARVDLNGKIVDYNRAFQQLLGYTDEELYSLSYLDITPPKWHQKEAEILKEQVYKNGYSELYDKEYRTKDGRIIPIELRTYLLTDSDAKPIALWAIVRDISSRKDFQKLIVKSEERLKSIFRAAPTGIGVLIDRVFKEVNDKLCEMTGYTSEELINQSARILYDNDQEYERVGVEKYKLINETGTGAIETIWKKKNGELIDILLSSTPISKEDFSIGITFTALNITARKRTEVQLLKSEENYRSIIELAADAILVGNPKGIIIGANIKACELTGYTIEKLIGQNINILFSNEALQKTPLNYDSLKQGKVVINERELIRLDGSIVTIEMNTKMMPDGTYTTFIRDISTRIESENKIRENELKFRTLFEFANDSIFLMDGKTFIDCNQKTLETFSCRREEIIGHYPYEYSPEFQPDGSNSTDKAMQMITLALKGESQFFYWKHKKRNGELFDAEVSLNSIDLEGKQFIQAIVRDITDRKKAEDALRNSEERFRTVVTSTPIVTFIIDNDGIFRLSEGLGLAHLGLKPGQVVGLSVYEFYKDFPQITDSIKKALSGETIRLDLDVIDITFDTVLSPIKNEDGNVSGVIGVATDITERKQVEKTLLAKTNELDRYFTGSLDLLCIADMNGVFYRLNPEWERTLGYPIDELIGKDLLDYVHPDDLAGTIGAISGLSNQKQVLNFVNRYKCKDDTYRWIEWRSIPAGNMIYAAARDITDRIKVEERLRDNENLLTRQNLDYLAINQELTERNIRIQEINAKLIRATERAQESDRLKSAFLANMSHEIRTPMNGIIGFCELLHRTNLTQKQIDNYVEIITRSGNQLLSIINDIIDISKIEAGQVVINKSPVSINKVVSETLALYSATANSKSLNLFNSINTENLVISTDETKLRQILGNLVNNAIKFTLRGSIEFGYNVKYEVIEFFIKDEGIGILYDDQQFIFDRFRQVEGAKTNSMSGTGLGLSICKSLVELMGGKIWVESNIGEGATFKFTLPLVLADNMPDNTNDYRIDKIVIPNLSGKIVLLVEDEEINMIFLKNLLVSTHAELLTAHNGSEAVELVKQNPEISIILMDIKMPVMNGIEATRIIKSISPQMPIIAQTAYAMSEEQKMIKEAGCDGYITKPVSLRKMFEMISSLLEV